MEVTNFKIINATSEVYNIQAQNIIPQYSAVTADVTIRQPDATYSGEVSASFYPNYGLALTPSNSQHPVGRHLRALWKSTKNSTTSYQLNLLATAPPQLQ